METKELEQKITELNDDIWTLETQCQELLRYGNVPKENWDKALKLLLKRQSQAESLSDMEELLMTILNNQK